MTHNAPVAVSQNELPREGTYATQRTITVREDNLLLSQLRENHTGTSEYN